MDEIKVLVADNSLVYKQMITQGITEVTENASVVSVAGGDEAYTQIKRNNFDIIIIDAEISGMNLFELLKVIRIDIPKAYTLVMARPSSTHDRLFPEAFSKGATECMIKPIYDSYGENLEIIKRKITDIAGTLFGSRLKKKTGATSQPARDVIPDVDNTFSPDIILIAASTGGPIALETIITRLRRDFPVPILIVQHIPASFTENLARNLNHKSKIRVKVAENDEPIIAGTAYIAPGGAHMTLDKRQRIYLDDSPPRSGVRPAADVLFESVAKNFTGSGILVVILTGMGSDGKEGLIRLKAKRECCCLVQSEETCVVYGMPRAVTEAKLADWILDLDMISSSIEQFDFN